MVDAPKRQQLTALQCAFDDTTWRLSSRALIIVTPSLLKITLTLGFYLDHRDNLGTGLHQVCLVDVSEWSLIGVNGSNGT